MQQVLDNEQLFRAELERINTRYQVFSEVRGQGMLLGAVLNDKFKGRSRDFFLAAAEHGLMALVAGADVVRFAPSLVITADDIRQGMQRFEQAVQQVVNA
jgi:acetylornithine/N-succinyldiaminopimelate aminotransferase